MVRKAKPGRGRPKVELTKRQQELVKRCSEAFVESARARAKLDAAEAKALKAAYGSGAPVRAIADAIGLTERTIRYRLRRDDVEPRRG